MKSKSLERLKCRVVRLESSWNIDNFLALYLSIKWPIQLTPEETFLALRRKRLLVRPVEITVALLEEVCVKIQNNPKISWEELEREYNINRYDLCWALSSYRRNLSGKKSSRADI